MYIHIYIYNDFHIHIYIRVKLLVLKQVPSLNPASVDTVLHRVGTLRALLTIAEL